MLPPPTVLVQLPQPCWLNVSTTISPRRWRSSGSPSARSAAELAASGYCGRRGRDRHASREVRLPKLSAGASKAPAHLRTGAQTLERRGRPQSPTHLAAHADGVEEEGEAEDGEEDLQAGERGQRPRNGSAELLHPLLHSLPPSLPSVQRRHGHGAAARPHLVRRAVGAGQQAGADEHDDHGQAARQGG